MASKIPRPVWLLGWTSFFTDSATEMIYPLLPVYLSRVLGASAASLGIIEGVAEAINSLLKMLSGWLADRQAAKPIVIAGYTISSAARPFIALTRTWPQVLAVRALDRTGKGIRGASRDAMLARFATPTTRGRIFGFHQGMDHAGAIVGPLLATAILFLSPENYRLVFGLTVVPGILAVTMLFFVPERDVANRAPAGEKAVPAAPEGSRALPRSFYVFMGVLFLFSLGNSADAFLLLRLADALGGATYVPLLWSGIHVVKASLSTWGGGLSDRFGRTSVIVVGWLIYAVVYFGFAMSTSAVAFIGWFLLYGVYFAMTEGAEKALVADLAVESRRGTAFGIYNAVLGIGALLASVAFGLIYDRFGAPAAFMTGAGLAAVASVLLVLLPPKVQS